MVIKTTAITAFAYLIVWMLLTLADGIPEHMKLFEFAYFVPFIFKVAPIYGLFAFITTSLILLGAAILERLRLERTWSVLLVGFILGSLGSYPVVNYLNEQPLILANIFGAPEYLRGNSLLGAGPNGTVAVWVSICGMLGVIQAGLLLIFSR